VLRGGEATGSPQAPLTPNWSACEAKPPALSRAELDLAEGLLAVAWEEAVHLTSADPVWGRDHVFCLRAADGRSAILKRPRRPPAEGEGGTERQAFGAELAALEFLNEMAAPIVPRLLGADVAAGLLVMEELPGGRSLADSLLSGDRAAAESDLLAYAEALARLHSWSFDRLDAFEGVRARYCPTADPRSWWLQMIEGGQARFLQVAADLGVPTVRVGPEIDELITTLAGGLHCGFVHGDPCPDNVRIVDGDCRLFDFELSGRGSVTLDAAFLAAPFPSCWCFGRLPEEAAARALQSYRKTLAGGGTTLAGDWDVAMAAALAGYIVARGSVIEGALQEDSDWGTATMRPRLLAWAASFVTVASEVGAFPQLCGLVEALHDRLRARWESTSIPEYPALANPGSPPAQLPEFWRPGL
jgi:Ser/Thr protein kinase RdoA (MazF antagonist)